MDPCLPKWMITSVLDIQSSQDICGGPKETMAHSKGVKQAQ